MRQFRNRFEVFAAILLVTTLARLSCAASLPLLGVSSGTASLITTTEEAPANHSIWASPGLWIVVGLILFVGFLGALADRAGKHEEEFQRNRTQLHGALALALETENFSEAHCEATAAAKREEFLERAAEIRAAEAERQLNEKKLMEQYTWTAYNVATDSHLEREQIIEILQNADRWNYRVLQAAIRQKERMNEPRRQQMGRS